MNDPSIPVTITLLEGFAIALPGQQAPDRVRADTMIIRDGQVVYTGPIKGARFHAKNFTSARVGFLYFAIHTDNKHPGICKFKCKPITVVNILGHPGFRFAFNDFEWIK